MHLAATNTVNKQYGGYLGHTITLAIIATTQGVTVSTMVICVTVSMV